MRGMRHGKFGSQLQMRREDGTLVTIGNIYQKNIEVNTLGKA